MIRSSIEKRTFLAKKEGDIIVSKNPQEPSSSRSWSGLKDPRIVRVSRTFGGKDRHSKVRTIKGLRDRRIRLSVPTAIQLYDLQDRLGLNQPSKVVDWLLNAAQHAIDELPPLQMLPENYNVQYPQPMVVSREVNTTDQAPITSLLYANTEHLSGGAHSLSLLSGRGDVKISRNEMVGTDQTVLPKPIFWTSSDPFRDKCKDVAIEKSDWMKRNEHENQEPVFPSAQRWTQNSFPIPSHPFFASSLNNVTPYASYYHLELPSNAPVSHLGHVCSSQTEELHNLTSGSQLLVYPPGATPSIIPSYITPSIDHFDPKHIANFQQLGSSSQNFQPNSISASLYSINPATRALQLSLNPRHHHSHNNHESQ